MDATLYKVAFEIFGTVQGVFFRKYTQKKALELGLVGWVRNTSDGTVKGEIQGTQPKIENMKNWLQNSGSPQSRIDQAVFSPSTEIKELTFKTFEIVR